MMRALFSGVSGLKNHQVRMDVIGNNIANVNTTGYKSARANFRDVLSQTMREATPPGVGWGGVNPAQVGLGMTIGGIDTIFSDGSLQATDVVTDLYLQGEGFFMLDDGTGGSLLTRAGNFTLDRDGNLVNSSGLKVMGTDGTGRLASIQVPKVLPHFSAQGLALTANTASGQLQVNGSITELGTLTGTADAVVGLSAYADLANQIAAKINSTAGSLVAASVTSEVTGNAVTFDAANAIDYGTLTVNGVNINLGSFTAASAAAAADQLTQRINVIIASSSLYGRVLAEASGSAMTIKTLEPMEEALEVMATAANTGMNAVTALPAAQAQFMLALKSKVAGVPISVQNAATNTGLTDGTLQRQQQDINIKNLAFDQNGAVNALYGDGTRLTVRRTLSPTGSADQTRQVTLISAQGQTFLPPQVVTFSGNAIRPETLQVALGTVVNPGGLVRVAGTNFQESSNSGLVEVGIAGVGGLGLTSSGQLEMSNVNLAEEITNLIVTQRGFQANARTISTSDEMLQELANLKR